MGVTKQLQSIKNRVIKSNKNQCFGAILELESLFKSSPAVALQTIESLSKHKSFEVRSRLSVCLVEHLLDEHFNKISKWAKSKDRNQRETLAHSLASLDYGKAIKLISVLSKDKDPEVRLYSLMWFFYHKDDIKKPEAKKAINSAKNDKDENVRKLVEHLISETSTKKPKKRK